MKLKIYILCLCSLTVSCSGHDNDKQKADNSIKLALQHESEGASLSEDTDIVDALDFYLAQHPTDTATIKTTTRLVASHYWWIGKKEEAYGTLERYIEKYPNDDICRYTLLNFLVLDSNYKKLEQIWQRPNGTDSANTFKELHETAVVKFYNDKTKEAIAYYEKAFPLVKTAEDSALMWSLALPAYADILSSAGNPKRAIEIRKKVLEHDRGNNPANEALSYTSLAWYYLQLKDFSKARHYIELAQATKDDIFDNDLSRASQLQIVSILLDYAESSNVNVKELALFVNDLGDKAIISQKKADAKREANQRLTEQNLQITIQRQKEQMLFGILSFVSLLAILGLLLWLRSRKNKLIEKEEEIDTLRKLLSESSKAEEDNKDDRFFKKIMLQQLGVIKMAAANPTNANQELLRRMSEIANKEVDVNSLLNWDDLYRTINYIYDGYYTQLINRFGSELNEKEIQLCCLLRANFSTKEISIVTQQGIRTVYQRKTVVRQKLGIEEKGDIASFIAE